MTHDDRKTTRAALAALGAELARRRCELNEHGHLHPTATGTSHVSDPGASSLRGRAEEDARHQNVWALLRYELARDFRAIADEFRSLVARADASETEWARTRR